MTIQEQKQEIEWRLTRRYGVKITLCDNLSMWAISSLHLALYGTRCHTDESLFARYESLVNELSGNPLTYV